MGSLLKIYNKRSAINLNFIDIDDTLFRTFTNVIVRNSISGSIIRELTNSEYNGYALSENEVFDFTQFEDSQLFIQTSTVIECTLNEIHRLHGSQENLIIFLTARGDLDSNERFKGHFKSHGVDIHDERILFEFSGNRTESTTELRKLAVIIEYLDRYAPYQVRIYDDYMGNLEMMDSLVEKYTEITFSKILVKAGKMINIIE